MLKNHKFNIFVSFLLVSLILICYFGWEIVLQERAMMKILTMSKNDRRFPIKPDSTHLEDVAEEWFERKKIL